MTKKTTEKKTANSSPTEKSWQFKKGQSGNPSGRPKVPEDIKEMFRAATPDAVRMLISVINNDKEKTNDRIKAAEIVLDRHLGKPLQQVDVDAHSIPKVVFMNEQDLPE